MSSARYCCRCCKHKHLAADDHCSDDNCVAAGLLHLLHARQAVHVRAWACLGHALLLHVCAFAGAAPKLEISKWPFARVLNKCATRMWGRLLACGSLIAVLRSAPMWGRLGASSIEELAFMSAKSLKIGASGGAAQAAKAIGGRIPYFPNIARKCGTYWDFGSATHEVRSNKCVHTSR